MCTSAMDASGWWGPSVSCMMESGLAMDVESLEMGDVWSGDDIRAWWIIPDPLEAMVKVL